MTIMKDVRLGRYPPRCDPDSGPMFRQTYHFHNPSCSLSLRGLFKTVAEPSILPAFPPLPSPPLPHPPIHLSFRNPVPHQTHHHPQTLHVSIPHLIIKEQHFLMINSTRLVDLGKVRLLIPRENLHIVEIFHSTLVGGLDV